MNCKAIRITGAKKSGKTAMIESLAGEIKRRGYKVAALKTTSHDHEFDRPDTDTWRYRKGGSESAVIVSPGEFVCHAGNLDPGRRSRIYEILYADIDLLLMEGTGELDAPIIEIADPAGILINIDNPRLLAAVSEKELDPHIKTFHPHEIAEIADFIFKELGIN